ncbi:MAG: hypothetical protein AAGJ73_07225 [Pseudomonadota bacterium]
MTDLDAIADVQKKMTAQLNEMESRLALIHEELRETASNVTRLKLMAGNAKAVEEHRTAALEGLTETLTRIESLLQNSP